MEQQRLQSSQTDAPEPAELPRLYMTSDLRAAVDGVLLGGAIPATTADLEPACTVGGLSPL